MISNLDILVKDNIRTLKLPEKRFSKPLAIILVGSPFSGKTSLAEGLAKKFSLAVLSDDQMSAFLAPRATFFNRGSEEIFILASKTIEELIRMKISCIYDASVKKRQDRMLLKEQIEKAGGRMFLIHVHMYREQAYKRSKQINTQIARGDKKGFIMDKEFFNYEVNTIEKPTSDERAYEFENGDAARYAKIENQIQALLSV